MANFARMMKNIAAAVGAFIALIGVAMILGDPANGAFLTGFEILIIGVVLLCVPFVWLRKAHPKLSNDTLQTNEGLIAIFASGNYKEAGFAGDIRSLVFTNKRVVAVKLSRPNDVNPTIKPHTNEFEQALAEVAKDTLNSEGIALALQGTEKSTLNINEIRRITYSASTIPLTFSRLRVQGSRNDINFDIIDKSDVESSLNSIKQAFPDKVAW